MNPFNPKTTGKLPRQGSRRPKVTNGTSVFIWAPNRPFVQQHFAFCRSRGSLFIRVVRSFRLYSSTLHQRNYLFTFTPPVERFYEPLLHYDNRQAFKTFIIIPELASRQAFKTVIIIPELESCAPTQRLWFITNKTRRYVCVVALATKPRGSEQICFCAQHNSHGVGAPPSHLR